ncbi:MAG: hypothetical protein DWQ47_09400 [Acidobacteria bacterium]|nr:MAG: hypothetical protein DWQ32_17500 [Acidobacteriota bacterium]REJ98884.1 MAG: hypothetical protein DWQ38_12475 [Acidobacteriota bacterium]REK16396.1 MAG: hypothetical protein DWQ43_05210 [Acidobacteriota bacterium]REK44077.1 MAG: hypothetical protein DWQ47_09400 [Acidobacteriota bacterium]
MRFVTVLVLFFAAVPAFAQSEDPARQFDFWIGEWDVNLRVQQPDKTWKDQHKAKAHIYSILGGKAILELWSEGKEGINGYSLRYYNPQKKKWDLWLNWAGKNRSGTNGLEGEFRHGRGEFFGETKLPDGNTRISRFTFSDISKNSLRWDDAFSTDGGKTWASNWIMEFTRKADKAPEIGSEQNLLTYFDGSRCDLPEFEFLKAMSAKWEQNEFLSLHEILDGCILIGFWSTVQEKRLFFTLTWNTYAGMYELAVLDNEPRNNLTMYYGSRSENQILLKDSRGYKASISTNADGEFVGINIGTPSGGSGFQVEAKKRP